MSITVASMFRDSQRWCGHNINQVNRFCRQVKEDPLHSHCEYIFLEGDSKDNTLETLLTESKELKRKIICKDINQEFGGSIDSKARMEQLGGLGDLILNEVTTDYLIWIESDLIFSNILTGLYESILSTDYNAAVISPLIFLKTRPIFYDTWGFRDIDKYHWTNRPPYSRHLNTSDRYIKMSSIGSCAIIDCKYIKNNCRFRCGAFVNLCKEITKQGGSIFVDKNLTIYHPSNYYLNQRWI